MRASEKLIKALKGFEGLRTKAYKCPAGIWTIGYGHTKGVTAGMTITEAKAEELLREDLRVFEQNVEKLVPGLTQPQFDALVDFSFNLGSYNLQGSTLLKKIKAKASQAEICYQFSRWNKAGGKVLPGLTRRRAWEAARFYEKD